MEVPVKQIAAARFKSQCLAIMDQITADRLIRRSKLVEAVW
jgi:hypothetical protein